MPGQAELDRLCGRDPLREDKRPAIPADLPSETLEQTTTRTFLPASYIAETVVGLVSGERQRTHGDKLTNHANIAALWNAYLGVGDRQSDRLRPAGFLTPRDVALMMALLKIARTKLGAYNPDDYLDLTGYGAVAGEIASLER